MNPFKTSRDASQVRLRVVMQSRTLVDEIASVVQNQVILDTPPIAITNRKGIPLYYLMKEGEPAQWKDEVVQETGVQLNPSDNSEYILDALPRFFEGTRQGTIGMETGNWFTRGDNLLKTVVLTGAVVISCALLIIGGNIRVNADEAKAPPPVREEVPGW